MLKNLVSRALVKNRQPTPKRVVFGPFQPPLVRAIAKPSTSQWRATIPGEAKKGKVEKQSLFISPVWRSPCPAMPERVNREARGLQLRTGHPNKPLFAAVWGLSSGSLMQSSQTSSVAAPERGRVRARLPELLAPAGDWECARAAVENGADAIYFGLEKFNARMRANNFTEADLPKLMEFLHRRGVKGYVTFNTLVFENELAEAEQYLRTMIAAGVDAAIVQDVGICRLIRQLSPDFPIHVSTQMTITSAAGVEFARELGCNLVVLARECSLKEIESDPGRPARRSTVTPTATAAGGLHPRRALRRLLRPMPDQRGAGRALGQPRRMRAGLPHALRTDRRRQAGAAGRPQYLLSPQDLAGLEVLPELARLGVASLKIEGRLKSPEYVANITRIYRQALDQLCRRTPSRRPTTAARSRPLRDGDGLLARALHRLVSAARTTRSWCMAGSARSAAFSWAKSSRVAARRRLDAAARRRSSRATAWCSTPASPRRRRKAEGCMKSEVRSAKCRNGRLAELRFGRGDIDFRRIHVGDKLWKTSDPELDRRLRQSFEGDTPKFQRPIEMEVHGLAGKPLTLIVAGRTGPRGPRRLGDAAGRGGEAAAHHRTVARAARPAGRHAVQAGRVEERTGRATCCCRSAS